MNDPSPRGFWFTQLFTRIAGRLPETPPPVVPLPPPVAYAPPAAQTPLPARKPHVRLMSLVKPEPTCREKSFADIDYFEFNGGQFNTIKQIDLFDDLTGSLASPRLILLAIGDPVQGVGIGKIGQADCGFVGRLNGDGSKLSVAVTGVRFERAERDPHGPCLLIGTYNAVKLSLPQHA